MSSLQILPVVIVVLAPVFSGCALYSNDATKLPLQGNQQAASLNASSKIYQKVKQAKQENSVILQVHGDSEPVRILPLPPGGKTVYVSSLLTQTGIFKKFGHVQVSLYRDSSNLMDGVRLKVDIQNGKKVSPATDYALRSGDRLVVRRSIVSPIGGLLEGIVPSNAVRGLMGVNF